MAAAQFHQHAFAAALVDPAAPVPAGLTNARGAADPKRFAVYRNNVVAGLGKALESRFPVTLRLVGEEFFRGMARAFIAVNRPRSPLIAEYGDALPAFIEGFAAAASVPYLADVARLEALWSRAYHAADADVLSVETLAAVPTDKLAEARLEPHPSAAILSSEWPVGSIWAAHQEAEVRPVGQSRAEIMLVVRPDTDVTVHILPAKDATFVQALFSGAALGDAAEAALAANGSFDFGAALVGLVGLGAFAALVFNEKGTAA